MKKEYSPKELRNIRLMHNSVVIFFSRVGIPVAMGLFIDLTF